MTLDAAMAEARRAAEAGDDDALTRLAGLSIPDPWILADALCFLGAHDAAAAVAAHASGSALARLGEYVESRRGAADDGAARRAGEAAHQAAKGGDLRAARAQLDAAGDDAAPVIRVRLWLARGSLFEKVRHWREAALAYRKAADVAESIGWIEFAGLALFSAGSDEMSDGDYAASLESWSRRQPIMEALGRPRDIGANLANVGTQLMYLQRNEEAVEHLNRAIEVLRPLHVDVDLAGTLNTLGSARANLGDEQGALEALQEAVGLYRGAGHRQGVAGVLGNLGSLYRVQGNYAEAVRVLDDALDQMRVIGDKFGMCTHLTALAATWYDMQRYPQAMQHYRRALELATELNSTGIRYQAALGLGQSQRMLGQYAAALASLDVALETVRAAGSRLQAAGVVASIASVYSDAGDQERGLELQNTALEAYESLGAQTEIARAHLNLGAMLHYLHRDAEARRHVEAAYEGGKRNHDQELVVVALGDLAALDRTEGATERGIRIAREALQAAEALGDRTSAAVARLNLSALLQDAGGNSEEADALLAQATSEARSLRIGYLLTFGLTQQAANAQARGASREAVALLHEALQEAEPLMGGLADEQSAAIRQHLSKIFTTGVRAAAALDDPDEALFFLESGRAGALLEALGGRRAMRWTDVPPQLAQAEADARGREAAAAHAYRLATDAGRIQEMRERAKLLDDARRERREVVDRIRRERKRLADVFYPRAASAAEIRSSLAPNEVLVVYGLLPDEAYAVVSTPRRTALHVLGDANPIREACERAPWEDGTADDSIADVSLLRDRLVAKLGLPAAEKRRWLVSPDGALARVPLSLLWEGESVVAVPSGTTNVLLRESAHGNGKRVLALGDPDYGGGSTPSAATLARRGGRLEPLPMTRDEVEEVGDVVLLGAQASEAGLAAALAESRGSRWRSIHFACHGLVDADHLAGCGLALSPDSANDGFLGALEVFRTELPTDLAVLSACDTGRGPIVSGEGVLGLSRAFLYAGADAVLCSLWKVDDEATRALMSRFYALWTSHDGSQGVDSATALREAQRWVREHEVEVVDREASARAGYEVRRTQRPWADPRFWAAWVLWGRAE